jgi:hypothetical protein
MRDLYLEQASAKLAEHPDIRISYWSFSNYKACPQRWAILHARPPAPPKVDTFFAINGSVVHSLFEDFTKGVKAGEMQWEDKDFLTDSVPRYYDKFLDEEYVAWDAHDTTKEAYRPPAVEAARVSVSFLYDQLLREGYLPRDPSTIHTELSFATPFGDSGGITLTGRTDLVFVNPNDFEVVDLKDVGNRGNTDWRQLIWYVLGLEPIFKKPCRRASFLLTKLQSWKPYNPDAKNYRHDLRVEILKTALNIRREPFRPIVSRHHCPRCNAQGICPEWQQYSYRNNAILQTVSLLGEGNTKF